MKISNTTCPENYNIVKKIKYYSTYICMYFFKGKNNKTITYSKYYIIILYLIQTEKPIK